MNGWKDPKEKHQRTKFVYGDEHEDQSEEERNQAGSI